MRGLPLAAWAYVCTVVALGTSCIALSSFDGIDWTTLAVLAVLSVICESVPALLSSASARVSLSYSAGLASVVLLGPVGAALVGASAVVTGRRDVDLVKRVFNGAQFALSGYLAGVVYRAAGGTVGRPSDGSFPAIIPPYVAALVTYVAVNLGLIAIILVLIKQAPMWGFRWGPVGQLTIGQLAYGMFGLLIAAPWRVVGPFSAVLVLLPMFIARWALEQTQAQQEAQAATIAALCQAVETKDYYTRGHSERVSRGAAMIAREIGMRPDRVGAVRYAGMLHDVGKLGVPTKVLQKSGALTEEEFAAIQLHPMRGLEIVRDIGFLDEALAGIMHHHERMDGTGYPMGLAGSEIPEFARVISVADAFDSMTSTRSYRPAMSNEAGMAELRRCAGTHFDPALVDAFVTAVERDGWTRPDPVAPPEGEETAQQDHDDPSVPLRVAGEGVRS
ncbi:HD-GYP domain-containing protein [Actinoallomurus rhizosphaericola]|uniref:HD-GYP domain-containing protein n=1 Tax=Actinoallomurus rhizosphaericola TaxID=2952536 RepID=UPI0020908B20|nr:HD-GYP domain-containing protein [Actinoallomurus rhizosphaericola]MCO5991744.1 HD-GYP domain-containing protein [Actinoallomurus rhizosphaericola]